MNNKVDLSQVLHHLQHLVFQLVKKNDGAIVFLLSEGRVAQLLDVTTEQVFGKTVYEVFPPEIAEQLHIHYERAFTGEVVHYELHLFGMLFSNTLSPIWDNQRVESVISSSVDITHLKETEAALEELATAFVEQDIANELLLNNILDVICSIDAEGLLVNVNKAITEL